MEEKRESVRKTALEIIEKDGLCYNSDIAKSLRIPPQSAAAFLKYYHREWGLTKIKKRSRKGNCAYVKDLGGGESEKDKIRDMVRETALQVIEEKKHVLSEDVAEILGISHSSAAMYLKRNYEKWGLQRKPTNSMFRHKYVRKPNIFRHSFKSRKPSIPNLAILFPEVEQEKNETCHGNRIVVDSSNEQTYNGLDEDAVIAQRSIIDVETKLLQAELKHELHQKEREMPHVSKPEIDTVKVEKPVKIVEEDIPHKLKRIIDDLHKGNKKVNPLKIIKAIEEDFGEKPDMDITRQAMKIYNNGIRNGKYYWSPKGYSTRKSI